MKIKNNSVRNAILIGTMCSLSYLAVYFARYILGAVNPQMEALGIISKANFGTLTFVYFITYAVGQLINGAIGDKIKGKYMIAIGLAMAGIFAGLFAAFAHCEYIAYIFYGMMGFFLAMIYGPMTKIVAENTEPIYATRCSLGYTFASFFGSPLANATAVVMSWEGVFIVATISLIAMSIICFVVFTIFEKKGIVKYNQFDKPKEEKGGSIRDLIRHRIIRFTLIAMITGVIRSTLVTWLPTFFAGYLNVSDESANKICAIVTTVISAAAFISVFVYERLGRNMDLTIFLSFACSAVCFALVCFVPVQSVSIVCMTLGVLTSNCAATMLWSRYCPSLRDTGVVSGATGFLDFSSYVAAGVASILFPVAIDAVGWDGLVFICMLLMVAGVITILPINKLFRKKTSC